MANHDRVTLNENDVIDALAAYLREQGYQIERQLTTTETGIDLIAVRLDGKRLLVEAKGGTSSKIWSSGYGRPFSPSQVNTHVAVALLYALRMREKYHDNGAEIAIALPDDPPHRWHIESIQSSLKALNLKVFLVSRPSQVRVFAAKEQPFGECVQ